MVHIHYSILIGFDNRTTTFYYLIIVSLVGIFEKALCVSIDFIFECLFVFALFSFDLNCIKRMKISAFDDSIYIDFKRVHWSYENCLPEMEKFWAVKCILSIYFLFTHTQTIVCYPTASIFLPTNKTIFEAQTTEAFAWIQRNLIVLLFLFNRIFRLTSSRFMPFEMNMWLLIVWYRGANERIHNVIVGVSFFYQLNIIKHTQFNMVLCANSKVSNEFNVQTNILIIRFMRTVFKRAYLILLMWCMLQREKKSES